MKIRIQLSAALVTLCASLALVFVAPMLLDVLPAAHASLSVTGLPDFTELVEKTSPAVVNIRTTEHAKSDQDDEDDDEELQDYLRRFLPPNRQQSDRPRDRKSNPQEDQREDVEHGVGSGFIISSDGYVMTNAHVVDGADEVFVTLTDKREYKAKIVGADQRSDVALVKIDAVNLPHLVMGESNKLKVGEWVIAIGSPFGLENSVSAGIVSAKVRDIGDYLPLIQTDVVVNPGNSGGPLINMRGEVVGINSQIFSLSGGFMGISFAVPIDDAMRVGEQLKNGGKVRRGRLGVQIAAVPKDIAESLGLSKAQGALVNKVEPGTPAEKAGIEAGDIVLKFNGVTIEKANDLSRLVGSTIPGTTCTLSIWRKREVREVSVVLSELDVDQVGKKEEKPALSEQPNALGLIADDLSHAQKQDLAIDYGVLITFVNGPAARVGLRAGDVISRLNDVDIRDLKQFNALVLKLDTKKAALLLVHRGDSSHFVTVQPIVP